MLSLGHCGQILANEKQESIATVSMKKNPKTFHFIRSSSFLSSQVSYPWLTFTTCQFNVKVNIHIFHYCVV